MKVCKSDGSIVKFDKNKIIQTCLIAGAELRLARLIASEVNAEGYEGLTTEEIRMRVYIKLKKINPEIAERYVYRSNMKVRTSSNTVEAFDVGRIADSLVSETKVNRAFAEKVAKEVEKELGKMKVNYVTAPLIREIVNVKLLEQGMETVRARYTRLGMPVHDVRMLIDEGSNVMAQYSPEAVHRRMSEQIAREYTLLNVLPFDIADAHMSGQIHIHDMSYFSLRPTTFSHDLRFFLIRGLKVDGTGEYTAVAGPAKKPTTAFMHAMKILVAGQTECSRGQYIQDFNVLLAPYVMGLDYEKVKQLVQMFFYEIAQTSVGRSGQAIYATLSVTPEVPKHLRDVAAVQPGGIMNKSVTYADFEKEANDIANAIFDVNLNGDFLGKPFIYPRLIYNHTYKSDDDLLYKVSQVIEKYGTPYVLNGRRNLYSPRRGTIQHVTVNLPQIGYMKKGDIFPALDNRMKKAFEVLLLKKKVMERNLQNNLLPFFKQKALGLRYYNPEKQQYVISYAGLNELVEHETGSSLESNDGQRYGLKVVKSMMKMVETLRKESDLDIVLTGDPKGVCYTRLAKIDVQRYGDKACAKGGANPYYSKSHYVNTRKLRDKLAIEGRFNKVVNGRTTTHVRMDASKYHPKEVLFFLRKALKRDDVMYLSASRAITVCQRCGYTETSERVVCGRCKGKGAIIWDRDSGHIQNIRTWNNSQLQAYVDENRYSLGGDAVKIGNRQKKLIIKA